MSIPRPGVVAELVRLPAVLSVPGDVLLGAAASGQTADVRRTAGLVGSSSCLYLAGMALNDYADRETDAVERPGRPIPSGRVSPGFALGLAGGLTVAGTLIGVAADGPRALNVVGPLAAAVWSYDLVLKTGALATPAMCACRGIDVIVGAGARRAASALPAAAMVAGHTAVVTEVSHHEVRGATPSVALAALAAMAGVATASAVLSLRGARRRGDRVAALGLLAVYGAAVGPAQASAIRDPSPARLQRAVGAGVLGLIPLEAALVAGAGAPAPAAGLAALWPAARRMARARAVT